MKKIIFLSNWGEDNNDLLKRYSKQTPCNSGHWKTIKGVTNINEADYYIVLGGYNTSLPQHKTIFIKREPNYIDSRKSKYIHSIDWENSHCGITWWINKSYDELKSMVCGKKSKDISCVVSSKHSHRNNYVKSLFKRDSPIDLYGKGHQVNFYGENYKGQLNYDGKCKIRGLLDYKYSIALENSRQNNYFTEKFADAVLSWTVPIYWGCPNIADYFPEEAYHTIDINSNSPTEDIYNIIKYPVNYTALEVARDNILDKYNIWEIIHTYIYNLER